DESYQNWFRPENRFPSRVFGSMVQSIGPSHSCIQQHMYFAVSRSSSLPSASGIRIVPYDPSHKEALCAIARESRGHVYVTAEEDFELGAIPVIADALASVVLIQLGAEYLRDYCQGIWLKDGNLRFYRHIDGFYSRLVARSEKHFMEPSLAY